MVNIGGTDQSVAAVYDFDMWLKEGVAEYIGGWPRLVTATRRLASVRVLESKKQHPTTIDLDPIGGNSSALVFDAFYGVSHLAVGCMATKYGEPKMIEFVKLVLRDDVTYDKASRRAFGKSFHSVDTACVVWIRQRA